MKMFFGPEGRKLWWLQCLRFEQIGIYLDLIPPE
jgi:hypothetical protein